jgi:hypothetical protein
MQLSAGQPADSKKKGVAAICDNPFFCLLIMVTDPPGR